MKKIIVLIVLILPTFLNAQIVLRNTGEKSMDFITRTVPAGASQLSLLAEDKFNSDGDKLVYAYVMYEAGNMVNQKDSSLVYYLAILSPSAESPNVYSQQNIKMITSYKKSTRIEKAEVVMLNKEKDLQIYISEMVRGPGGVPRDVKRTLVYKQDKQDEKYTGTFSELKQK